MLNLSQGFKHQALRRVAPPVCRRPLARHEASRGSSRRVSQFAAPARRGRALNAERVGPEGSGGVTSIRSAAVTWLSTPVTLGL